MRRSCKTDAKREPQPPLGCQRVAEKRYLFTPGPTPVPPEVLAALAEPVVHHRGTGLQGAVRGVPRAAARGVPHRERRPALHRFGHRCDGVGGREPLLAGRPGGRRLAREPSASAGRSSPAPTAVTCRRWSTSGARRRARRISSARLEEVGGAKAVFLTHSETSTGVVCDLQALAAAAEPSGALVVVDAVSSARRRPARAGRMGDGRRRLRLAKGPDDPAGARARVGLACGLGAARDEPALLLRLGAHACRAGEAGERVHPGRVARASR